MFISSWQLLKEKSFQVPWQMMNGIDLLWEICLKIEPIILQECNNHLGKYQIFLKIKSSTCLCMNLIGEHSISSDLNDCIISSKKKK